MKAHSTQYVFLGPIHSILFWPPPALDPFLPTSFSSVFFFSAFFFFLLFFCWPPSANFEGALNTLYRALSGACFFLSSCTCFQPCMVLRKTTQHGSTRSFQKFKNNVDILHIEGSARITLSLCCDWADSKSEPPKHRFRRWGWNRCVNVIARVWISSFHHFSS